VAAECSFGGASQGVVGLDVLFDGLTAVGKSLVSKQCRKRVTIACRLNSDAMVMNKN
jgi:hypothetical protein